MIPVRAKFRFAGVKTEVGSRLLKDDGKYHDALIYSLEFRAVSESREGDATNKLFWDATPSGTILMNVVNEEAAKQFTIGKYYYVDFMEAPA